jgi:hypothetical protein
MQALELRLEAARPAVRLVTGGPFRLIHGGRNDEQRRVLIVGAAGVVT